MFQVKSVGGQLCNLCVHKYFWGYTLFTLCFGWWGFFSFLMTPFAVLQNVIRYVFCLLTSPVPYTKPRDGATASVTEPPNPQKPVAKKMEVIWDLPEAPVTQREASKPIPDGQAGFGASADWPRD